jgi:hypothetical protein
MHQESGNGLLRAETHDLAEGSVFEILSRVERDLNELIGGLALLGVKRCSQCRQFFRCADPGALFDYGKLVCYECVSKWWPPLSAQLNVRDREEIEGKLSSWLRKYHRAEVVKEDPGKLLGARETELQIVTHCRECRGSGRLLEGERCRFCNGHGTVWIVVPK